MGRPIRGAHPTRDRLPVIFTPTTLDGVVLIEPEPQEDERGFFARVWCERDFARHGITTTWVQCNVSFNPKTATVRGMHYQRPPHAEAKLIRCTRGAIFDVALDLRPDSPRFTGHVAVVLSAANHKMLFIPEGLAHGFQTLEDDTEVFYQMSAFYAPECAAGVRWDDPAFAIDWPRRDCIISKRDASYSDFTG